MYKKNYKEAAERNKLFLKRKLMDRILFKAHVKDNPYKKMENRDTVWKDRDCLAVSDPEWAIENCRYSAMIYQDIDDDTIPEGYPTLHFGESFYSAMLGGEIQFIGTEYHTCSGAKPIIHSALDIEKLKGYENNHWVEVFKKTAKFFANKARGNFWLKYMIAIDALNLAVELMGTTDAYIMLYEDEKLLREIMKFGVEYNFWFYKLQKEIFKQNNQEALGDPELYELYDKTWYSVDAYDLCRPETYKEIGFEYQQELINKVGGGLMHTHGTGVLNALPIISQLKGISVIQAGRDLSFSRSSQLGTEHFHWFRKTTGDIPLSLSVSKDEFLGGIKNKSLPGGAEYICYVDNIEEANKLAYMAKEYRV